MWMRGVGGGKVGRERVGAGETGGRQTAAVDRGVAVDMLGGVIAVVRWACSGCWSGWGSCCARFRSARAMQKGCFICSAERKGGCSESGAKGLRLKTFSFLGLRCTDAQYGDFKTFTVDRRDSHLQINEELIEVLTAMPSRTSRKNLFIQQESVTGRVTHGIEQSCLDRRFLKTAKW